MDINKEEYYNMNTLNNKVLLKPIIQDKFTNSSLYIPQHTIIKEVEKATRRFMVAKCPDKIKFNEGYRKPLPITPQMDWSCDMELRPGIIVYTNYMVALNAPNTDARYRELDIDGDKYIFANYGDIILAVIPCRQRELGKQYIMRGGTSYQILMLNGFVLIEKDEKQTLHQSGLILNVKKKMVDNIGTVKFIGSINSNYKINTHPKTKRKYYDSNEIKVGNKVIIDKKATMIPLEYTEYRTLFPNKEMFYIQNHDIAAIL